MGGGGSVEKAICPSVSSQRREPTGSKADGNLKVGRTNNQEEEGRAKGRRSKQRRVKEDESKEKEIEVMRDAKAHGCFQKTERRFSSGGGS